MGIDASDREPDRGSEKCLNECEEGYHIYICGAREDPRFCAASRAVGVSTSNSELRSNSRVRATRVTGVGQVVCNIIDGGTYIVYHIPHKQTEYGIPAFSKVLLRYIPGLLLQI